jgi:peptidyl-prolyl cis-trans isomerase C
MRRRLLLPVFVSSLLSVAGAGLVAAAQDGPERDPLGRPLPGGSAGQDVVDPTRPPPPPQRTPADEARRARVIARVGDVSITVGQVEDGINQQSPFLRARYRDPEKIREFVDNMIRFELMAREAEKRGMGRDANVARTVKQNAVQALIRRDFDERITLESVPEADIAAYFASHGDEFNRPEMRRASHVLVATREEAERIAAQARDGDVRTFRELAREHSLDQETKLRGGDLRYFTREPQPGSPDPAVDPAIVAAAFALREVGDVSAPVQVGERWSVVKLTGLRPAETRTLADAAPSIRMRLWRERRQKALDDFVVELQQRYRPEVHPERVDPIRLDAAPPGGGLPGFPGGDPHGEHGGQGEGTSPPASPAPRAP